jgi:hypothetical protein
VLEDVQRLPEEVLDVILSFPKDVLLLGPIIPPFAIAYKTSYASSIDSYDTNKSKSEAAPAPP